MPGFEDQLPLNTYENCFVEDTHNWKCTYADGSGGFGFNNGFYFEEPIFSIPRIINVSEEFYNRI